MRAARDTRNCERELQLVHGASGIQRPLSARGLDFTTNDFDFGSSFRGRGTAGNERARNVAQVRPARYNAPPIFQPRDRSFFFPQFFKIGSDL